MSYLYEKYDFSLFDSRFRDYKRQDQFSPEGFRAIFNYLTKRAEDSGKPIEVDVIAICCDFHEDTIETILGQSGCETLEELNEQTTVLEIGNGNLVIVNY